MADYASLIRPTIAVCSRSHALWPMMADCVVDVARRFLLGGAPPSQASAMRLWFNRCGHAIVAFSGGQFRVKARLPERPG
ncbi:hypothetical protein [Bradyrhizobium sp. S69]|uniref:hypothetical protein n=1 Tax=Bradyrhizobium sp. S69 TaxID=1641856 RepID=UPI00131CA867|nr:hypothetical protein [Bradyrhizobium sp. S69]